MARACPNCQSPELATIEQLLGSAPVTVDDDGTEHWNDSTDVHWTPRPAAGSPADLAGGGTKGSTTSRSSSRKVEPWTG